MAVFVINEWIWADLSGQNGRELQVESLLIIERLPKMDHQIVIVEGSSFDKKAWGLCSNSNEMVIQAIGGAFVANIRQDSDRCLILKPESLPRVPDDLASATKEDDHYLLQAVLSIPGATLVTTDEPLRLAVGAVGLLCLSRTEFLALIRD